MLKGLIGKKIGMTQIFDENGAAIPVTIIEAGPCYVTQVCTPEKEGYSAVQLGFDEVKPKRISRWGIGSSKRRITSLHFAFCANSEPKIRRSTKAIKSRLICFAIGEAVDVVGVSKG